jgi:glycosyltransferase involved in cell wall biosynthesis
MRPPLESARRSGVRWICFGTYDVRRHPRVGVLIEGLRASGDEVVEVNAPLPLNTAGRVALVRQPWRAVPVVVSLARCWFSLARGAFALRRSGFRPDAVLVGYLGLLDVRLARRLFPGTPIVLDHLVSAAGTARDRSLGGPWRHRVLRALDEGALRRADTVVVDTPEHAAALPPSTKDIWVVVPVGAGSAWFSRPASAGTARGPLRVVFVGLFTPLHGTPTIGAALGLLAGDERIEVTMVGIGQDYRQCRDAAAANPRVSWLDWVDSGDLPALVGGHDVCLGIFGTTAKARNVVPTKVFQGAAAGCAIVTSDTEPQRRILGDAAMYVPAGDPAALAEALSELAASPSLVAGLKSAASQRAAAQFAPAAVVAPLRDSLSRSAPVGVA